MKIKKTPQHQPTKEAAHTPGPRYGEGDSCPICNHKLRFISDGSILCNMDPDYCDCLCGTAIDKELAALPWREGEQVACGFRNEKDPAYISIRTDAEEVARVLIDSHGGNRSKKYARLIAAAPQLLEAAQDLMAELRKHYSSHPETASKGCRCAQCKMIAAIAKAEGREGK